MTAFTDATFAHPRLDLAFRQERALLDALIGVAAAIASNAAPMLEDRVGAARTLGATDGQLRVAAQLGRVAKRGAENETEATLATLVDAASDGASRCAGSPSVPASGAATSGVANTGGGGAGRAGACACGARFE